MAMKIVNVSQTLTPTLTIHSIYLPIQSHTLTPSFQPAMGMTPTTETVMKTRVIVAISPTMMFPVANTKMGNAKQRPITRPITAEDTRF